MVSRQGIFSFYMFIIIVILSNQSLFSQSSYNLTNSGGTSLFYVKNDGKIGIGTVVPVEILDVSGAIKIGTTSTANSGTIRWTGTDFEGYNGSSWSSLTSGSSGSDGDWTISGSNIFSTVSGNVGIGISIPSP